MAEIIIYTVKDCPKCEQLKREISYPGMGIADMSHPVSLSTLRCNDVFTLAAPVLQVNNTFLTVDQIFKGDNINLDLLGQILSGALRDDVKTACDRLRSEGWDDSANIVNMLYSENQKFRQDLNHQKQLNDELMGHCNQMRKQLHETK